MDSLLFGLLLMYLYFDGFNCTNEGKILLRNHYVCFQIHMGLSFKY